MSNIDLLAEYLYNKGVTLENEYIQLLNNVSYRDISPFDLMQQAQALSHFLFMQEVITEVMRIISESEGYYSK